MKQKKYKHLVIIGAPKCGTSSMHSILDEHPHISMARGKEINYFIDNKGDEVSYDNYLEYFDLTEETKVLGEASPRYMNGETDLAVYEKMQNLLSEDTLFVYMVRDPLERISSMYFHRIRGGLPMEALTIEMNKSGLYLEGSNFVGNLKKLSLEFDIRPIIIEFQKFILDPRSEAKRIINLLGLDTALLPENGIDHRNKGDKKVPLKAENQLRAKIFQIPKRLPKPVKKLLPRNIKVKMKNFLAGNNALQRDGERFKLELGQVWEENSELFIQNKKTMKTVYNIETNHWCSSYEIDGNYN